LYVQEKHTPEKERKKRKKKDERERAKTPKITPKTLNHQIQMAPPKKKKKQQHLRESGSHRHKPEI
jgi:hypothetical protein